MTNGLFSIPNRWQLSGLILAPCLYLFSAYGITKSTIIANLLGGCIFYFVDKEIFNIEGD